MAMISGRAARLFASCGALSPWLSSGYELRRAYVPVTKARRPCRSATSSHWSQVQQALEIACGSPRKSSHSRGAWRTFRTLQTEWERLREQPFCAAGAEPPQAHHSAIFPTASHRPIVQYILELSEKHPLGILCRDSRACRKSLVRVFPPHNQTRPAPRMDAPGPRQPAAFSPSARPYYISNRPQRMIKGASRRPSSPPRFPTARGREKSGQRSSGDFAPQ